MSILRRLYDYLKVKIKFVKYGNVVILIGQRGTGKSETIKSLCKNISGPKFVVRFDTNLKPQKMHADDKKDYEKNLSV